MPVATNGTAGFEPGLPALATVTGSAVASLVGAGCLGAASASQRLRAQHQAIQLFVVAAVFWCWSIDSAAKSGFDFGVISFLAVLAAVVNGAFWGKPRTPSSRSVRHRSPGGPLVLVYARALKTRGQQAFAHGCTNSHDCPDPSDKRQNRGVAPGGWCGPVSSLLLTTSAGLRSSRVVQSPRASYSSTWPWLRR